MAVKSPIVPTEIVVHIGSPSEAGKNIKIPFSEYIKNVASNEIYPSWPTDAIKANILAQISFALNRIYNEWYPSQGYNFDITSSPSYDQTFKEDSQFFENISQIVDDIFNNYIVKEEQIQPLFAAYCDGINTKCDGLSQWGSVELAREGLSPLEILKRYYGNDIKIIYNAPVSPNIPSYPGFPFRLGSVGNYVRQLKIQLNRISNNYPTIPKIAEENIFFTTDMEESVRAFQEIFDLPVTGEVDKETWYKVKYLYNAVKKIADLSSEGIGIEEVEFPYGETLQEGESGPYIRPLNYLLNFLSYFDTNIPNLNLSGETFTEDTKEMVIAFQTEYDIAATGIVDKNTWNALVTAYNQTKEIIPEEYLYYEDKLYPGIFLSKGMSGDDILNLQNFLYTICEKTHQIPGVIVTGTFDDLTEESIISIQRRYNLPENGIVGPATWQKIIEWVESLE